MPSELNPLWLLLTRADLGVELALAGGRTIHVAPIPLGFFPALFWTALFFFVARGGPPRRTWRILTVYAAAATLLNAWIWRQSVSSLAAFVTALFAGSAAAVWLAAPLAALYAPPFRPPGAAGGPLLVGVPAGLLGVFLLRSFPLASLFLLGSISLGLLVALQLIGAGLLAPFRLSSAALLALSTALAVFGSLLLALLPHVFGLVYAST